MRKGPLLPTEYKDEQFGEELNLLLLPGILVKNNII
jgi:hypothetical protein